MARIAMLAAVAALLLPVADRGHWRRSDHRPVDPRAVAEALERCEHDAAPAAARERSFALCMARQGYFTWDGV